MARKQQLPKRAVYAIVAALPLIVAIAGWMLVISPQRAKVAQLKSETAQTQKQITDLTAATQAAKRLPKISYADLYQLVTAMPDQADMPDVLLELDELAQESGITFNSISPQPALVLASYEVIPIRVSFVGTYYELNDLLLRLRSLVSVRGGHLDASGRLFAIDQLSFGAPTAPLAYPQLAANLQIDAFVYGSGASGAGSSRSAASAASGSSAGSSGAAAGSAGPTGSTATSAGSASTTAGTATGATSTTTTTGTAPSGSAASARTGGQ